jgi:predicted nucleic acid-binding protein
MDEAAAMGNQIALSAISLAEIVYLIEKSRGDPTTLDQVLELLDRPNTMLVEVPFDRRIASAMRQVDRASVPDFPDRIIAATALHLGVPLISRDGKIRMSNVTTIW